MLLGREAELAVIASALREAGHGVSKALVISGDPGIGKTALLNAGLESLTEAVVLRTRGVESEQDLPYVALADLFSPLTSLIADLPVRQASAIAGALALGPSTSGDRFAVAAATLSLIAKVSADQPVIIVVDDFHWIDQYSADALLFAVRRLQADPVAVLVTVRGGESEHRWLSQFDTIHLRGLDDANAVAMLKAGQPRDLSPAMIRKVVKQSAGNPLALVELPRLLKSSDFDTYVGMIAPLPVGTMLRRAFLSAVQAMPDSTIRVLHLLATLDEVPYSIIGAAIEQLDLDPHALEVAESSGLVLERDGKLVFKHPLVRAAVYHSIPGLRRRDLHMACARVAAESGVPDALERQAVHLVAAGGGPNDSVAALLRDEAAKRLAVHYYASAAHLYAASAELSGSDVDKATALTAAGNASRLAGDIDQAARLLNQASVTSTNAEIRLAAGIHHLRLQLWQGRSRSARDGLMSVVTEIEQTDRVLAAALLSDVALAGVELGDIRSAAEAAGRATALAENTPVMPAANIMHAFILVLLGETQNGRDLLDRYEPDWTSSDTLAPDLADQLALVAGLAHLALEDRAAQSLIERSVDAARSKGAVGVLRTRLAYASLVDYIQGDWSRALASAHEALTLIGEESANNAACMTLANLARIEAGLGLEQQCREHALAAQNKSAMTETIPQQVSALYALGLLDFGRGNYAQCITKLDTGRSLAERMNLADTPLLPFATLLAEAYARAGDADQAMPLIDEIENSDSGPRYVTAIAIAHRCRALLSKGEYETHLQSALDLHSQVTAPFETARTQLTYGQLLRRDGNPRRAEPWLRSALSAFEKLGAANWQTQAATELTAIGSRSSTPTTKNTGGLTAQEVQVALAVAEGLSNAEVAEKLFLSVKTVEFHLSNTFRKLQISRRGQLARLVADQSLPIGSSTGL